MWSIERERERPGATFLNSFTLFPGWCTASTLLFFSFFFLPSHADLFQKKHPVCVVRECRKERLTGAVSLSMMVFSGFLAERKATVTGNERSQPSYVPKRLELLFRLILLSSRAQWWRSLFAELLRTFVSSGSSSLISGYLAISVNRLIFYLSRTSATFVYCSFRWGIWGRDE